MRTIDGDSHFIEPFSLWEQYVEPKYRDRAPRCITDPATGRAIDFVIDGVSGKSIGYDADELMTLLTGWGEKDKGISVDEFDHSRYVNTDYADMDQRVKVLDEEGFDAQVLYPSFGLVTDATIKDPLLMDAVCRAYNTWAFELCDTHKDRLYPAAHLSLLDPQLAIRELERTAKLGCYTAFLLATPVDGNSWGHSMYDPVWAAAQDLNISISIHIAVPSADIINAWHKEPAAGMFSDMCSYLGPRMALTTMMFGGVFDRFPKLRVATLEARAGWVPEWVELMDHHYAFMAYRTNMKRKPSEYFGRNIWVNAFPQEKMLPAAIEFLGEEIFFVGSDYPHTEGFTRPIERVRELLSSLPETSVDRVLGTNAANFFGI